MLILGISDVFKRCAKQKLISTFKKHLLRSQQKHFIIITVTVCFYSVVLDGYVFHTENKDNTKQLLGPNT